MPNPDLRMTFWTHRGTRQRSYRGSDLRGYLLEDRGNLLHDEGGRLIDLGDDLFEKAATIMSCRRDNLDKWTTKLEVVQEQAKTMTSAEDRVRFLEGVWKMHEIEEIEDHYRTVRTCTVLKRAKRLQRQGAKLIDEGDRLLCRAQNLFHHGSVLPVSQGYPHVIADRSPYRRVRPARSLLRGESNSPESRKLMLEMRSGFDHLELYKFRENLSSAMTAIGS